MKLLLVTIIAGLLAGCGVEMATTAATSAAIKKQEVESGKQIKDLADRKIEAATQAIQERADEQRNADK